MAEYLILKHVPNENPEYKVVAIGVEAPADKPNEAVRDATTPRDRFPQEEDFGSHVAVRWDTRGEFDVAPGNPSVKKSEPE